MDGIGDRRDFLFVRLFVATVDDERMIPMFDFMSTMSGGQKINRSREFGFVLSLADLFGMMNTST